ncbi:lipid IV(A) 3-deoxy-D-manno-octulosonic acid transferase [Sulfurirhabdus autotrophica]|uniref:3-deoxy-D-manno-octulosonic acid transferase n=1 Tax=Sulfurirhabdus autotrophica TaxID=1706046 RepID=A0A4R3XWW0_9PROT|nr:lipid IV(A) 3-deoxy-D-manno-octulosonic acid transferase [Sulfurirhabdus autotrophica]TCV84245.1 3-deoxy-D-manno-octulosonic-acid transferase [Sulfurirhabdus autotrophica]
MIRNRTIYTVLLFLLLPYVAWRLLWRGRRQPAYHKHIRERFGFYSILPLKPLIWIHAVSVGETRAAVPLVKALQAKYPQHQILLTHMTPTGRETSEMLFGENVLRCYLPYDYPFAAQRFLQHFKPAIGILMETEIWFNLIHACKRSQIPLILANARLSDKSAKKYARLPHLTNEALKSLEVISAQTEDDAARLHQLGATSVTISGNLKFDVTPPETAKTQGETLRIQFGADRPVFLASSTRDGEEALILEALTHINTPNILTVIVPRHPQRFDEVAVLLEQNGIQFQRKSDNLPIAEDTKVVLGDTMGELFAYYGACDIAFIGGSLLPYGGQNLIEASAMGVPALIGPHTFNFTDVAKQAVDSGAAIRIENFIELAQKTDELLLSNTQRIKMAESALLFSQAHRGATDRLIKLISPFLD